MMVLDNINGYNKIYVKIVNNDFCIKEYIFYSKGVTINLKHKVLTCAKYSISECPPTLEPYIISFEQAKKVFINNVQILF